MRKLAVCVVIVAACGGNKPKPAAPPSNQPVVERAPDPAPPPPPAEVATAGPTDEEFERMMEQAVAMFDAMGAAADANPNDCGKLADAIEQVLTDNEAFLAEARRYHDSPEMDQKGEAWMKANQDRVMAPMMKVATAGQKCASDAKFMAVMERLGKLGE